MELKYQGEVESDCGLSVVADSLLDLREHVEPKVCTSRRYDDIRAVLWERVM